mmetsp:Transcript_100911/g.308528  ORF Transcript_100911/g.308528 Transcript_100911/m.308528 type:complete len:462 (-) Transcript_100911:983-2368(-)
MAVHAVAVGRRFLQQLLVAAGLDHPPVLHPQDLVGLADRAEAVRNDERGPALHQVLERLLHHVLRDLVERRSRLVQQQDRRIRQDGTRDADALLFAASDVLDRTHLRLQALGELRLVAQGVPDIRGAAGRLDVRPAGLVLAADADVVADSKGYQVGLLGHSRDLRPQPLRVEVADVPPVEPDAACADVVEPLQQAEERALPTSGLAHDANDLPRRHLERHALEHAAAPARVLEEDVLEEDVPLGAGGGDVAAIRVDLGPQRDQVVRLRQLGALVLRVDPIVVRALDFARDLVRVLHEGARLALVHDALVDQVAHHSELRDGRGRVQDLPRGIDQLRDGRHPLVPPLQVPHGLLEQLRFSRPPHETLVQRGVLGAQRVPEGLVVLRRRDHAPVRPVLHGLLQPADALLRHHLRPVDAEHIIHQSVARLPHPPSRCGKAREPAQEVPGDVQHLGHLVGHVVPH